MTIIILFLCLRVRVVCIDYQRTLEEYGSRESAHRQSLGEAQARAVALERALRDTEVSYNRTKNRQSNVFFIVSFDVVFRRRRNRRRSTMRLQQSALRRRELSTSNDEHMLNSHSRSDK